MNMQFSCTLHSGKYLDKKYISILSKEEPTKQEVLNALDSLKRNVGAATLKIVPEPDIGITELSVECDGEKYLFTLAEYSEDGYLQVRTKTDFVGELGLVNFMGEPYPSSAVITDFDFIKSVFIEFLETGNVSQESMSL
ncbi:DUF6911 family protein [Actinobacillus capsulatus]|uniref:DUF6911 family protein n=1 Tax=Actinobacillus capsulatus TaxID=717 RepID=UPI0003654B2A|nr:hypothetical protein [Actinobacillus capsulatus]